MSIAEQSITQKLRFMPDKELAQYAETNKNNPYIFPLAFQESQNRQHLEAAKAMSAAQPPKVVDQNLASMHASLPEEMGIGALPAPNIKHLADGGIAGYDDGGMAEGGGPASQLEFNNEPVIRMAEGGMKKLSGSELFDAALDMEGVDNPVERAFLKSIHGQESSGKANSKDSNRGAKGAMQVMPDTFKSVADPDMDINKPLDNMRAGIRYGRQGFSAAKGDPVLAGAYYYGGPGGMQKAAKGIPVSDPKNPDAPTTIGYGKSIAQRMTDLLPISTAQAAAPQGQTATEVERGPEGSSVFGGATGLGALLGAKLGSLSGNLGKLNNVLTPATRAGIAAPAVGMGAGIGAVGGALSAGAANALSNATPEQLSQMEGYGADPSGTSFAAAIMNPENRKPQAYIPKDITENQSAAETARLKRQNDMAPPPPALQKKAIETAQEEMPKDTLFGMDKNTVMMLGLQLMAGQSPYALVNAGEAGLKTIAAKQADEKAKLDRELVQAHKEYYGGAGAKARAEAKALEENTRGLSGLIQAYAKDPMALKMLEASDNPQDQKLAALIKSHIQQMVGQAPTVLGAPQGKVLG
jgi:hypothetical protein